MAWNQNYFPTNYQPMYPQFQTMQQPPQQPVQTRMVEVVPVPNEQAVLDFPVPVGVTQQFMATDDSFVAFKSNSANGQINTSFYDHRPPAPKTPEPEYMTRADVEAMIAAALPKRTTKKEAAEE